MLNLLIPIGVTSVFLVEVTDITVCTGQQAVGPSQGLTGVLIADIVLQLLSHVAQAEWEFNRQRQAEGIVAAKAKGVHFGRKFKDWGENYESVVAAWRRGELSGRAAARELGVAHGTFQRWCKE